VTTVNVAFCWGWNREGEVGDGTRTQRLTPVRVLTDVRFSAASPESSHVCGVSTDGRAYCWGFNAHGQLGDGSFTESAVPIAVVGGHHFTAVSAGPLASHTCGVTPAQELYCWGLNSYGQLGDGTTDFRNVPVQVNDPS
jgi:alpha-tubulin suppressor-like RCC1 family protein